ncbi:MAG: NAD(P)H-dependent glycerol-3-phosphate dehydrogenase [Rhodospirillales bacterium]
MRIAVVGAGAWGTALACAAARAGSEVKLWARRPEQARQIAATRENAERRPGHRLPDGIAVTAAPQDLADAEAWLLVVPAQSLRARLTALAPVAPLGVALVICAKGIERGSGLLLDRVVADCLPRRPIAVLSGPTFAGEVAAGLPAAISLAAEDEALGAALVAAVGSPTFRPYRSRDVTGLLLGGATKNVIGLAAGIVAGRGLGENARAALLTRGLAEMTRLGRALGAQAETMMGLAGLGDLILTGTSPQSRNYSHGLRLGRGETAGDALVEGAATAGALVTLAAQQGLELPIAGAVAAVLAGDLSIDAAVEKLLARPFRPEEA